MRIALVADWLVTFGGAEHVIAEMLHLFPGAPLYTTLARRGRLGTLDKADIRTSNLQRLYNLTHQHQVLLSQMPRAIESLDLRGYDVVISSSHAVAKGIIVDPGTLHICYCHTPVRYAWEMEEDYLRDFRVPRFMKPYIHRKLMELRRWDLTSAKRVDRYIANSTTTQERIKRIYNRDSIVISPPVDDRFFEDPRLRLLATDGQARCKKQFPNKGQELKEKGTNYFLAVGRFVPYKRFDLLIQLANELKLPLKIAGRGQDEKRLRRLAGPTVEFLGFVPDSELPGLYANAEALFFPQYEDAGIVLLEAQATGTPVIAFNAGGAKDMVIEGKTGVFFHEQTIDSLRSALDGFRKHQWKREEIQKHARQFSQERFRKALMKEVQESFEKFQKREFVRV